MIVFKLSSSLILLVLLQSLASAAPIPPPPSLRRGTSAPQGAWGFGRRNLEGLQDMLHAAPRTLSPRLEAWVGKARPGGDLPPVKLPTFPKTPPPHSGGDFGASIPHQGTTPTPVPSKGVPRRKGGYPGPGGHGRRSLEGLRELLYSARRTLSVRGPAWEGERPSHGDLPPVHLPPFSDPPPPTHVPGNWSGTAPHQGSMPTPIKGVPRRKGGFFGPGHGRRGLDLLQDLLPGATVSLFGRAHEGGWAYTNYPKSGDLPPVELPPFRDPAPKHGGGNYAGPGPHEGITQGRVPAPIKGNPRRKGGYFGPGHGP